MTSYVIKKKNKNNEIVYMEYSMPGQTFTPKTIVSYLNVKNVKIVDEELNNAILTIKFEQKFQKLIKLVNYYLNTDDDTSSDSTLILDEIALIKGMILNKYNKYLSASKTELFLKKLSVIEKEIKIKDLQIKSNLLEENKNQEEGKQR